MRTENQTSLLLIETSTALVQNSARPHHFVNQINTAVHCCAEATTEAPQSCRCPDQWTPPSWFEHVHPARNGVCTTNPHCTSQIFPWVKLASWKCMVMLSECPAPGGGLATRCTLERNSSLVHACTTWYHVKPPELHFGKLWCLEDAM